MGRIERRAFCFRSSWSNRPQRAKKGGQLILRVLLERRNRDNPAALDLSQYALWVSNRTLFGQNLLNEVRQGEHR
jgi:hypothetical protein